MITADHAMEQAHATARLYATYAKEAYEAMFGTEVAADPQAAATFMAGFMQAASTDYAAWALQNQLEGLRDDLDSHVSSWADSK